MTQIYRNGTRNDNGTSMEMLTIHPRVGPALTGYEESLLTTSETNFNNHRHYQWTTVLRYNAGKIVMDSHTKQWYLLQWMHRKCTMVKFLNGTQFQDPQESSDLRILKSYSQVLGNVDNKTDPQLPTKSNSTFHKVQPKIPYFFTWRRKRQQLLQVSGGVGRFGCTKP